MGIVNVTPDSFSDGGKFLNPDAAVARALELVAQGAEILDIGGESTRPGAEPVSETEELRRVIPVIKKLTAEINSRWGERPREPQMKNGVYFSGAAREAPGVIPLHSIDTMKPAVARAALAAGAEMVNDVGAARADDTMWRVVAEFQAGYVCMHAPPQLHQLSPQAENLCGSVARFFRERLARLAAAGVPVEQVLLDPGIGFGKTLEQNLELLAGLRGFIKCGRPLVLGVSRKSFIGKILGAEANERLPASLACATLAVANGVQIIRTHDVAETAQAVRMTEAVLARCNNVEQPR
jgi:dihydropteroate synthase